MAGKSHLKIRLEMSIFLLAMVSTTGAQIVFVDDGATGANDGSSWADAHNDLQDALVASLDGDAIWVAEGTYLPDRGVGITLGDRTATFELKDGVALYGGFPSAGGDWEDRDPIAYETILSGDLNSNDVPVADPCDLPSAPTRAENSYHVVTGSGTDATAVLDGFTITAGNANGSDTYDRGGGMYSTSGSPTLTNCTFSGNAAGAAPITTAGDDGGGMYSTGAPTLTNCTFSRNAARDDGGGMCNRVGSPILTNCTFSGNSAISAGGMYNGGGTPTLTNCTFSGNSASSSAYGGGMYNSESSPVLTNCTFSGNSAGMTGGIHNVWNGDPTLTNCILWGNSDAGDMDESAQISTSAPRLPVIYYCCIQGWTGSLGGAGNIGDDPLFVDADGSDDTVGTADDDLRLSAGSACIDAGDNSAVPACVTTDLDGLTRFFDDPATSDTGSGTAPIVDMGAYEFGSSVGTVPVYRFWSPQNSRHFYTVSEAEKDYVIATYPANIWTYETVAYYAFPDNSEPGLAPVYRFWSPQHSAHFYTISEAEKDSVIATYPATVWSYEGPVFYAYPAGSQPAGASPVYRFWSPLHSAHFFTISEAERDSVVATYPTSTWTYEGIAWYAYE